MKRAAFLALALALAACAGPGGGRHFREGPAFRPSANPGEVVATELAFARAAREKGQWTAFAEFAADDAVMFAPGPVNAKEWLKGRENPAQSVAWEPYQVWSSCDGSLAVSKGGWTRPDGSVGYFTTVWQRQQDGSYKWVLDQGDTLKEPLREPDLVQADVADCPSRSLRGPRTDKVPLAPIAADGLSGKANDGSLTWTAEVGADNSRALHVHLRKGGAMAEVLTSAVAAPAG